MERRRYPDEFKCPISLEIMADPVLLNDGFYYDRECIIDWLGQHARSPMTNLALNSHQSHQICITK